MMVEALTGVAPVIAGRDVLHEVGDGEDQPGDKAAARQVVAAQVDVDADHHCHRQQNAGAHGQHHGMAVPRVWCRDQRCDACGDGGTVQQRFRQGKNHEGSDAKDDDLAIGIIAAEIHDDGVDCIGAARAQFRLCEVKGGDRVPSGGAGHQLVDKCAEAEASDGSDCAVAQAARGGAFGGGGLGQEMQGEEHEEDGHHLYRNLGQGEVRGREIRKGYGDDQAKNSAGWN